MFTGIIRAQARIKKQDLAGGSLFLTLEKPKGWKIKPGDSVSTDGVCLTVKKVNSKDYTTQLMPETLSRTTFGKKIPKNVNLEQSLKLGERLDGHLVMGHVDGVGKIALVKKQASSRVYSIKFPKKFKKLVAPKGAITVDGISLTIVGAGQDKFTVVLVDYTIKQTTLDEKKVGDLVNLEFDILAKYARS